MKEFCLDGINIFNPINDKLDYFVDAFTTIYGKKYYDIIKQRLYDANYIFVLGCNYTGIMQQLLDYCSAKKQTQINEFLGKYHLTIDVLNNYNKQTDFYAEIKKGPTKLFEIMRVMHFAGYKFTKPELIAFIKNKNNNNQIFNAYALIKQEVSKIEKNIDDEVIEINAFLQECAKKIQEVKDQQSKILMQKLKKEVISIRKLNGLNDDIEIKYLNYFSALLEIGKERFTTKYTLFNKANENACKELIAYLGFGDGEIKDYAKDDKFLNIAFNCEKLLKDTKEETIYHMAAVDEPFKDAVDKMFDAGIKKEEIELYLNSIINYYYNLDNDIIAYVQPFLSNKGIKKFCVCKSALNLTHRTLIHEMGHIIDGTAHCKNNKGFMVKDGLTIVTLNGKTIQPHFNLFNEVVNDYIALKVTNQFNKNNLKVGFCKQEKSSYEDCFFVLKEFLDTHFNKLIEFKLSNQENEYIKYFGFKNIQKLDQIATKVSQLYTKGYSIERLAMYQLKLKNQVHLINKDICQNNQSLKAQTLKENKNIKQIIK